MVRAAHEDLVVPIINFRDLNWHAGSFGRTVEDVILLDSIVRRPNCSTTSMGALPTPVSCNVTVDRGLNLTGLRIGLPSTFGWAKGLSSEVSAQEAYMQCFIQLLASCEDYCKIVASKSSVHVAVYRIFKKQSCLHFCQSFCCIALTSLI